MVALYRDGRPAEALAAYQQAYRRLADELGVEPGRALKTRQRQILSRDGALDGPVHHQYASDTSAASPVPRQLPAGVKGFIGRAGPLSRLDELLQARDRGTAVALALHGPAGIGKTALALQWAHAASAYFPDGQLYIDLCGHVPNAVDPGEALGRLLRALGVPVREQPANRDEAAALYRSLLAGRRMLVLLDNARSAEQVSQLLPGGPSCIALITSRYRLTGLLTHHGVPTLAVEPLTFGEAATLVEHVLDSASVRPRPEEVIDLVHGCARLPRALRAAAARLTGSQDATAAGS